MGIWPYSPDSTLNEYITHPKEINLYTMFKHEEPVILNAVELVFPIYFAGTRRAL